jgi:hypothetical protein
MRNHIMFIAGIITFFVLTPVSNAALIDQGNGLIYDDDLDITWLRNANYPGSTMTWDEANAWAEGLIYGGYSDWRLPVSDTCSGSGCSDSEMGHLYYSEGITSDSPGPFTDVKPYMYWSSTEYSADTSQAWRFSMKYGTQGTSDKGLNRYAWAVRDGSSLPAAAPEPSSAFLFLSGMATLWGIRKKTASAAQ